MSAFPQFNRLKQCRHGMMLYNVPDIYIGRSFYSGNPVNLFGQIVSMNMLCLPRKRPQQRGGLQPVRVPTIEMKG